MIRYFASIVAFTIIVCGAALAAKADTFTVDPNHSMVIFQVNHMNVSNIFGRFNGPTGTFTTDDDASKMAFDVSLKTENIDTGNAKRDQHLKSADFFDAKQYPDISFKSTSIKKTGDNTYEVTGDLTLHGVTKSITVTLNKVGEANIPQMGQRAGFDGSFTVKRTDFGMDKMVGMVGDEVKLWVNLEGGKK